MSTHPEIDPTDTAWGNPLRVRNFRIFFIGETISLVGDQFYIIALPWLVLQLTGDPFVVGSVLALAAIPRAVFMLVGGAATDRFSPRTVMLLSNLFRMALVAILAAILLTGSMQLWMLYILALAFGLADAFFFPAASAIVPQLVSKDQLQAANAYVQGVAHLSLFLGPLLAGVLISLFANQATNGAENANLTGIALAFAVDALTFLASAFTLWLLDLDWDPEEALEEGSVWGSIKEGLVFVGRDVTMRTLFLLIAGITFLINGPLEVGIAVLADTRMEQGAAAFGIIMAGFGGGALVGTILGGALRPPPPRYLGSLLMLLIGVMGIGVALLGFVTNTLAAAAITFVMGAANGYVVILFVTWLQRRAPQEILGRVMSVLMFALVGLNPISVALAGALIAVNLTLTFLFAGILLTALTVYAAFNPAVRAMGMPTEEASLETAAAD